ncbi:hypothetical protein UM760_10115 [Staphylococcus aureus]|nr:hypothetical protein UM760_10115 [Staphylococcus aureus]
MKIIKSALSNYKNIIEQGATAMDTTVTEIVENNREWRTIDQ